MARIKRYGDTLDPKLTDYQTFITDSEVPSIYVLLSEFKDTLTGGKNGFMIEGSPFLQPDTQVYIQVLDVNGNPIYNEPADGLPEYYEGLSKVVSMHIYEDTPIGAGKITILAKLQKYVNIDGDIVNVPDEWKNKYNYKWERIVKINPKLPNSDYVRFYRRPKVSITEIPKILYNNTIQPFNVTGTINGIPLFPREGESITNVNVPTTYLLRTTNTKWSSSLYDNTIQFNPGAITSSIVDIVNDTDLIVNTPYTINGKVAPFTGGTYSINYKSYGTVSPSAITGSFAKIRITNLETFVGDVYRVKIYRKSESDLSDWQFVQELKLESNELLVDLDSNQTLQNNYGIFTEPNIQNYWAGSATKTFNNSILLNSVLLSGTGVRTFYTSQSIDLVSGVEYSLSFNVRKTGSIDTNEYISAYISGSGSIKQQILTVPSQNAILQKTNITKNIVIDPIIGDNSVKPKLYFDVSGSFYISDVSLMASQETSFSPDVITFIQSVPRSLPSETFSYRFEFYDVNNNYIPVDVHTQKTFTGGNSVQNLKSLRLSAVPSSFVFDRYGNISQPSTIAISATKNYLTGSIIITSQSYDTSGNVMTDVRGTLTKIDDLNYTLSSTQFEGDKSPITQYIKYTATCEDISDTLIVSRVESGVDPYLVYLTNGNVTFPANSKGVVSTSNLSIGDFEVRFFKGDVEYKFEQKTGQNTPAAFTYSTSSLTVTPANAITYSSSFDATKRLKFTIKGINSAADSGTIAIPLVDNAVATAAYTSSYVFSKAKAAQPNITFSATPQAQTIDAYSTGTPVGSITDVVISGFEGNTALRYNSGVTLSAGEYKITDVTADVASTTHTNSTIHITSFTGDTAVGIATIEYKDSEGTTGTSSIKFTLSKAKRAVPIVECTVTPQAQTVTSYSTGGNTSTPISLVVKALEGGTSRLTSVTAAGTNVTVIPETISYDKASAPYNYATIPLSSVIADNASVTITVNYTDSEGSAGSKVLTATISRAKAAKPTVVATLNPQTQTVNYNGTFSTPSTITLNVSEGGTNNYTYQSGGTINAKQFKITNVTNASVDTYGIITPNAITNVNGVTGTVTYSYTDSEGTAVTGKTINFNIAVAYQGANGVVITLSPPSQTINVSTANVYSSPIPFKINVTENGTLLTHTAGTLTNGTFTLGPITNGSLTGGSGTSSPAITPTKPTTVAGIITSLDLTYKTSGGITSQAMPISHSVDVVLNGTTGPGIVHTGVWQAGRAYQYSDGLTAGTGRRDTVLWSATGTAPYDTYYAATTSHTSTNDTNPSTGKPGYGPWVSLGTQSLFVAAKIGIFEESYVQNTLNIGTSNNGGISSANITLHGATANPYISIGQSNTIGDQKYGVNGIWIGNDANSYKLSLVNNTTSWLKWDGTTLDIKGGGTFSGDISAATGTFTGLVSAGTNPAMKFGPSAGGTAINSGLYLNANNYWYTSSNFKVGGSSQYVQWDGSTLTVNGNINIVGGNAATTAYVQTTATSSTTNAIQTLDPRIFTDSTGKIVKTPTTSDGLYLGSTAMGYYSSGVWKTYMANNGNFYLTGSDGYLTWDSSLSKLEIKGTILATTGSFLGYMTAGGFKIGKLDSTRNGIYFDSNNYWYENGSFKVGTDSSTFSYDSTYGMTTKGSFTVRAGSGADEYSTFRVSEDRITLTPSFLGGPPPTKIYFDTGLTMYGSRSGTKQTLQIHTYMNQTPGFVYISGDLTISDNVTIIKKLDVSGDVQVIGDVIAFYSSDMRYKKNISPITDSLNRINKISGYNYTWSEEHIDKHSHKGDDVGVIAQEIQEVLPLAVTERDNGYLAVSYQKLIPLLIEGIKELSAKVDTLEKELNFYKK